MSLIYLNVYDFTEHVEDFPQETELYTCKETAMVKWMRIPDFVEVYKDTEWAFSHNKMILEALEFWGNHGER